MATYQEVLRQAKKDALNTDATEQSIMLLMHSIASHHNINLYANYMQEIDPTINQEFDDGFQRLLMCWDIHHFMAMILLWIPEY